MVRQRDDGAAFQQRLEGEGGEGRGVDHLADRLQAGDPRQPLLVIGLALAPQGGGDRKAGGRQGLGDPQSGEGAGAGEEDALAHQPS
jgi:hypothetical protein